MTPEEKCEECDHRRDRDYGSWCYMFLEPPKVACMQFYPYKKHQESSNEN